MNAKPPLMDARNIHKSYSTGEGALPVLRGVSLSLHAGQSSALTGESGSGKSTLLHILGCLDAADEGQLVFQGRDIAGLSDKGRADLRRREISVIFQHLNLIPSLTVAQNLSFQARLAGRETPEWQAELVRRLGLSALLSRYPEELSGGQQQRVAIGRAVAHKPALILADEPTGNLDEDTAGQVLDLLLELAQSTGAALLMVTHSAALAARLDRRLHLRQGKLA